MNSLEGSRLEKFGYFVRRKDPCLMNQSSIKPIGGVQQPESNMLSKMKSSAQTESEMQAQLVAARKEKAQVDTQTEVNNADSLANVSIHFRVDDKSNNVTVFLTDRKSKKVLRSIPASELQKLQIGDLLKLTV